MACKYLQLFVIKVFMYIGGVREGGSGRCAGGGGGGGGAAAAELSG